ncbi:hybrid sensor histidine kinase/response regulator, partial [bacterium]
QVEPLVDVIETDPKKLQQILMQLLTNALKFTERGEIALAIKSRFEQGGAFVEICVSDTGIGISQRDQEVIFEEFRQLDGSSTRQYGGTGLGLGLCRKLARSLGGRIEVESEVGRGSIFSLTLPVRRSSPEIFGGVEAF